MKKRLFALTCLGCFAVVTFWFLMTRSPGKGKNGVDRRDSDPKDAVMATARPIAVETARPASDRADPLKIFEAIEATNVPINFWGKVVDQDRRAVSGAIVQYDCTIEHGNLAGVAWSEQEVRTGETVSDKDGLFSVVGWKGHELGILAVKHPDYQFRSKGALSFDFYGSTASGKFVSDQRKPVIFAMVQNQRLEPLIHIKGSLRVRGDGAPERWSLWEGEPDTKGELAVTFRRQPAVLERPGQAATWSADLEIVGGGIVEAPWDEELRRAPEAGYLSAIAYPQAEQKRGVPYRSFYVKTADGKFGRIQFELDAYSQGETARCSITGDMNPRPGSRNLEPTEDK